MKRLKKALTFFAILLGIVALLAIYVRSWQVEITRVILKPFQIAAEHGNVTAQFELGYLNLLRKPTAGANGISYTEDIREAVKWLTMAANQGSREAQYELGVIYYKGEAGWRQDNRIAYGWFYKAAQQDDQKAREAMVILQKTMTRADINDAIQNAP